MTWEMLVSEEHALGLRADLTKAELRIAILLDSAARASAALMERTTQCETLRAELASARKDLAELRTALAEKKGHLASAMGEAKNARQDVACLQKALSDARTDALNMRDDRDRFKARLAQLQGRGR